MTDTEVCDICDDAPATAELTRGCCQTVEHLCARHLDEARRRFTCWSCGS
jgi:hypothetical protein